MSTIRTGIRRVFRRWESSPGAGAAREADPGRVPARPLSTRLTDNVEGAAETDVGCAAVGRVGGAGRDSVPIAVGSVAQIRTAAHGAGQAALRSHRVTARCHEMVVRREPVGTPLPHVA